MRKLFITLLVLVVATILISGCSSQKYKPTRWQEPSNANIPPVAQPTVIPSSGYIGDKFLFSSDLSYDPDGMIVKYLWNFNDGTTDTTPYPTHEFLSKGLFKVSLTVWDDSNAFNTDYVYVDVDSFIQPPDTTIDTVIVIIDTTGMSHFCGQIRGPAKEIVWFLQNSNPGNYQLDFQAETSSGKPAYLIVDINGEIHYWNTGDSKTLTVTAFLSKNATIKITKEKSQGDATTVCCKTKKSS